MKSIECIEDIVKGISVFKVKDQNDVLLAEESLKSFGIKIFTDSETRNNFVMTRDGYLIKEDNGGWRLQSHYIGNGFPVEELVILVEAFKAKKGNAIEERYELIIKINKLITDNKPVNPSIITKYNELTGLLY